MDKEIKQQALDMIHSLGSGIAALGDKIGVGAAHMWPVMVKQQYIAGLTGLINDALGILAFILLMIILRIAFKSRQKICRSHEGVTQIITMIICAVIGIPWIIASILSISTDLQHLINPEYYAAIDLINRIK